jgi:hypothetical protein
VQGTKTGLRLALVLVCLGCLSAPAVAQPSPERAAAELMDAVMWNREPVGGPFALTDQNGARIGVPCQRGERLGRRRGVPGDPPAHHRVRVLCQQDEHLGRRQPIAGDDQAHRRVRISCQRG